MGDDLDGIAQVGGHAPDDEQLLGVLLAEVRAISPDEVEQDGDDGGDAIEVSGPGRALERQRDRPHPDRRVVTRRVDLVDRRREHEVRALLGADRDVAGLVRGYCARSAGSPNWRGFTKIETTVVAFSPAGATDQGSVAGVQPAHRRDEADRARRQLEGGAELLTGPDNSQRSGG